MPLFPSLFLALFRFQAGGGGSFGGGGGGGFGGGGGDGDGIGVLVYFLIRLVFEVPVIGIPLLILVVIVAIKSSKKGASVHRRRVIRKGSPRLQQQRHADLAARIQSVGGAFDERAFLTRVQSAFHKIQESWCAQDLGPVEAFLSDGVLERFTLQFEEQKQDGWRQGMAHVETETMQICHFESGEQFETVTVRIPFRAEIQRLDRKTGKPISGSQLPRNHFVECWSFVRRRGAPSVADSGLIEGKCPNCGVPLAMNQFAQCGSCQAFVRSGEFDWILTEITQASEWKPEDQSRLPGLPRYRKGDPGISVQLLEDQASVAFWRHCAADRLGLAEPLVRVASEDYLRSYRETFEVLPGRDRNFISEVAVGSVRCLGILAGESKDHAIVEILSDGCRATVDEKGGRRVESRRHLKRVLYVFERPTGKQTNLQEAFSSSRCDNCGAHDAGGTAPRCPYCDAPRTGGKDRWLLAEVLIEHSPAAREMHERLDQVARGVSQKPAEDSAPQPVAASVADLVTWAAQLIRSDGRVDGRERAALHSLATRLGLSAARIEEMFEEGGDGSSVPVPRDTFEARDWMRALMRLGLEDGELSREERRLLKHTAKEFSISSGEFEAMLSREEKDLYRRVRRS